MAGQKEAGKGQLRDTTKKAVSDRNKKQRDSQRKNYSENVKYREQVKQATRENYREKHPNEAFNFTGELDNSVSSVYHVYSLDGKSSGYLQGFTCRKLSKAFGYSDKVIERWAAGGIIPRPVFRVVMDGDRKICVYSMQEASIISKKLVEHYNREFRYVSKKSTKFIDEVYKRLLSVRPKVKLKEA